MVIPEHRNRDELEQWKQNDPLKRFEETLLETGAATRTQLDELTAHVEQSLDEALAFATESPMPDPQTLLQGFWAT